jgi:CSLREA domain-containing protein
MHAAPLVVVVGLLAAATPAWADSFTVDSTLDAPDAATGNGRCETAAAAACTLRAAVQESNELDGKDRIVLPAGTYRLTLPGDDENLAATGDLDLRDDVDIVGRGTPTVHANGAVTSDRAFDVQTEAAVALSGLRIVGGSAIDSEEFVGGGILNRGRLELSRSTVTKNTAVLGGGVGNVGSLRVDQSTVGGAGGDPGEPGFDGNNANAGGGMINANLLGPAARARVTRSTVSGNVSSTVSEDVGVVIGGGVASNSALELENVTVTGNRADAGEAPPSGSEARAGGIAYDTGIGQLSLVNVTVSGNGADEGGNLFGQAFEGAGPAGAPAFATAKNTIVANPSEDRNCAGTTPESRGNNLEYDANSPPSCGFNRTSDLTHRNPLLGPLADNRGPTKTLALRKGSAAIGAGANAACPPRDQRGVRRPQGPRCDIGAFERGVAAPPPSPRAVDASASPCAGARAPTTSSARPDPTSSSEARATTASPPAAAMTSSVASRATTAS